jgi:hypothetical protein
VLPSALPRVIIAERGQKTALSSDLRVQELVATVRGALIDLAWKAPDFDAATRQLVGFELFRDDISTRPPSRLTSQTMPGDTVEARGLQILPHSEYGVQAIWRIADWPYAAIEFGPPRLTNDLAGPAIVVPPEERIHSLAALQRQGLITTEELEQAVEQLLGRAQPAAAGPTSTKTRRLAFTYIAIAVVMVLALVVVGRLTGRLQFNLPSAVNVAASPSPSQPSNSPSPTAGPLDLSSILIKPTDLRLGYVAGQYGSNPLCAKCLPAVSSLSVVFQNAKLKRTILSAASVAPSSADSKSVATALMAYRSAAGGWNAAAGLGDEGYATTTVTQNQSDFFVVWRSGAITNEIMLVAPVGSLKLQDAIDVAMIQQAREALP